MTHQSLFCPKFLSVCAPLLAGFISTPLCAAHSVVGSKAMYEWMKERDHNIAFMPVDTDHDDMIPPENQLLGGHFACVQQ